jgi:succinate-acetate transporter protein
MLQELRDYWLPLMLFCGIMFVAIVLLALVTAMPFVIEDLPVTHPLLQMIAEDATVRRTAIAGAIGLVVTACVFFRPNAAVLARQASAKKPPPDTMAGA